LLIEEARTNLLTKSAELDDAAWTTTRATITANAVTAPDGTTSADKLVEDSTASNTHRVGAPNYSAVSGTSYTFSVFLKSEERAHAQIRLHVTSAGNAFTTLPAISVNLSTGEITSPSATVTNSSIVSVGNGWWRVSISAAATSSETQSAGIYLMSDATTTSYTGDGTSGLYIWGAQLEAGAFPTSYIPTTTAAATRAADSAVVTPISSFYNQAEGTLFAEVRENGADSLFGIVSLDDNSSSNRIDLRRPGVSALRLLITKQTIEQSSSSPSLNMSAQQFKVAGVYRINDAAISVNGGAASTGTPADLPSLTHIRLGSLGGGGGNPLNGHIRKIAYWPKRLSNTLLEQLTT
jgi:hypothetical protein